MKKDGNKFYNSTLISSDDEMANLTSNLRRLSILSQIQTLLSSPEEVVIKSVESSRVLEGAATEPVPARRGINLRGGRETGLMTATRVADVMSPRFSAVPLNLAINGVREKLLSAPHGELFVVAEGDRLCGTITLADLADGAFDHSLDDVVNAGDVARLHPPTLQAGDSLDQALKKMQTVGEEHIAVVESNETMVLVGFIHEIDVMLVYNRALLEARREERGEI